MFRTQFSLRTLLCFVLLAACTWKLVQVYWLQDPVRYSWHGQTHTTKHPNLVYGAFGFPDGVQPGFAYIFIHSIDDDSRYTVDMISEAADQAFQRSISVEQKARSAFEDQEMWLEVRIGNETIFSDRSDDQRLIAEFSDNAIRSGPAILQTARRLTDEYRKRVGTDCSEP